MRLTVQYDSHTSMFFFLQKELFTQKNMVYISFRYNQDTVQILKFELNWKQIIKYASRLDKC